jgi:hypothetical protein
LGGLLAVLASALMLAALGLLLSVTVRQLENFAGAMNFVIFPLYFLSTALYPLWKLQASGAGWVSGWPGSTPSPTRWSGCALPSTASRPGLAVDRAGHAGRLFRAGLLGLRPAARAGAGRGRGLAG